MKHREISHGIPLEPVLRREHIRYLIDPGEISSELPEFAKKTIWFGRRGGKNIVDHITVLPMGADPADPGAN